jgi:hypothetical protein
MGVALKIADGATRASECAIVSRFSCGSACWRRMTRRRAAYLDAPIREPPGDRDRVSPGREGRFA